MSVPEDNKKTEHQVVKVSYDTNFMHRLVLLNILLSIILVIFVYSLSCQISTQQGTITQLGKIINELTFTIAEFHLNSSEPEVGQKSSNYGSIDILKQIEINFDFQREEIKKLRNQLSQIQALTEYLAKQVKVTSKMIEQQSRSSWQMKQVIQGIKSKVEYFTSIVQGIEIPKPNFQSMKEKIKGTFSNIKDKVNEIPRPDLEAMKDSIKGTFSDIKDKVNGMFENQNSNGQNGNHTTQNESQDQEGIFDRGFAGIRDKIRRKWVS